MTVPLPIEILSAETTFPFLDATLAELGIATSSVKERVVWADTRRTQVKTKAGELKAKEVTVLEVRVKTQQPDEAQIREVVYGTETHSDRSFGRSSLDILPWKHAQPKADPAATVQDQEDILQPVEITVAVDIPPEPTETEGKQKA